MKTKILLFGFLRLAQMREKGNRWYIRNYETYFDEVHYAYLVGCEVLKETQERTTLVSLGGSNRAADFFLAPWRLYRYVRHYQPDVILTADLVFSWWASLLVRLLGKHKTVLMPVCIPEQLYKDHQKSLSGLPIWLERRLIAASFSTASIVLTAKAFGGYVDWLEKDRKACNKLLVVPTLVDALPTFEFFEGVRSVGVKSERHLPFALLYVGRLHHEKLVGDLIQMMCYLRNKGLSSSEIVIRIIGDGPEKETLQRQAKDSGVEAMVEFLGGIENAKLPKFLMESDVFVSPLTGSSLREAALCGVPVVAYDRDWIHGLLRHEQDALLAQSRDYAQLAECVIRLMEDETLRRRLGDNIYKLAQELWSRDRLNESLEMLHRAVSKPKALQS